MLQAVSQTNPQTTNILPHCAVCENSSIQFLGNYCNKTFENPEAKFFSELKILKCTNCGFSFTSPPTNDEILNRFYETAYRSTQNPASTQISQSYVDSKYSRRGLAQLLLSKIFLEQSHNKSLKILDIGSGPGAALRVAQKIYPKAELFALEPDSHSAEVLRNLGCIVYQTSLNPKSDCKIDEKFDVIIFSHVLEHFDATNLEILLVYIKKMLAPKGVVVLEVPYEGLDQLSREHVDNYDLAPHLSFFTAASLHKLLEKHFSVKFCQSSGAIFSDKTIALSTKRTPKKKTSEPVLSQLKQRIKNFPGISSIVKIRRKILADDVLSYIADEQYTYGGTRGCIRAVLGLQPRQGGLETTQPVPEKTYLPTQNERNS